MFSSVAAVEKFVITVSELKLVAEKGKSASKAFDLIGLIDNTEVNIIASQFVDKGSGEVLMPQVIKFNNTQELEISVNKGERVHIELSVISDKPGQYQGNAIFISNNSGNSTTKLPLQLDITDPNGVLWSKWIPAIGIFLLGFGISSIFHTHKYKGTLEDRFDSFSSSMNEIGDDLIFYRPYIKYYEAYRRFYERLRGQLISRMNSSDIEGGEYILQKIRVLFSEMISRDNLDLDAILNITTMYGNTESELFTSHAVQSRIVYRDMEIERIGFDFWRYVRDRWKNFMALYVGGIILGLAVALGSFMQQDYIQELSAIDWISFVIIFSIGIGIDQIRQIIDRISR